MRKIAICIFWASTCQFAFAEQPPIVGLWEQLAAGDTSNPSGHFQRVDIVFADQKIDEDTQFSGLMGDGSIYPVLCCVKASKDALITLPGLLKKYPWDTETADHLRKITGGKYIYEASVVDPGEQNLRMRTLIKDLSLPPSLSPYSAPVISGKILTAKVDKKFKVGNTDISYSPQTSRDNTVMSYRFSINGKTVTLTEELFPD